MSKPDLEVVNVTSVGDLGVELDVEQIALDSNLPVSKYVPENSATFLRFEEDEELIILYRSGKYILRGGASIDNMHNINDEFLSHLRGLGVSFNNERLDVKNIVAIGDLNKKLDLNILAVALGFEDTEYEPEQFPGLIYRPSESRCVLLVFSSGKVVVTGGRTVKDNEQAFSSFTTQIDDLLFS